MRENCLADRYREFAWVDEERAWKDFRKNTSLSGLSTGES